MASEQSPDESKWRLGGEPHTDAAVATENVALPRSPAEMRLGRGVYVVTVEHLAWMLIAAWTLISRIAALGARPVNAEPARHAMLALAISRDGLAALPKHPAIHATWIDLAQGWVFAAIGASDASSRIVVALCGLMLVAIAFAMRPHVGRAGALALAAMLALSPSVTYFSLSGSPVIASMTFMMVAILVAASMMQRPTMIRAVVLGCAIALWLTADPIGYLTAVGVALSLAMVGMINAFTIDHPRLRARVWWERRRKFTILAIAVAIALWACLVTAFFAYPITTVVVESVRGLFWDRAPSFGILVLTPIAIVYEFTIAIFACIGVFVALRRRAGFSRWLLVWSLLNTAEVVVFGSPPDWVVALLVSYSFIAAPGFEWIFQSARWNSFRYPIAALAALTLYIQIATSFVYAAPNINEAAWNRHALLFWTAPVTSIQTARQCARIDDALTSTSATAYVPDDAPQVAWYLRRFAPAASPDTASIVVTLGKTVAGSSNGNPDSHDFGFEESWTPDFTKLTPLNTVKYLFTQRVWSDVEIRNLSIQVRRVGNAPAASSPLL